MDEKQFIIRLNGLTIGNHLYEFEVTDSFFESRNYCETDGAHVVVKLELVKQNSLTQLNFMLAGTLNVACDRCTKPYPIEIDATEQMFVKHGNPDEEHPENVLVLAHDETELDISQPLYEFISLALPARRVPCEEDPAFKCDEETLKKLNEVSTDEPEQNPGDSIWDKLKNIDFNN
ncbi:MAG TPA: DUF177 domain-containing protein [Bacteroidia bacterium]|jgi:uncharacterized protein|nr:DUF177 domain-containing protein [Bacteroidia bacterium]